MATIPRLLLMILLPALGTNAGNFKQVLLNYFPLPDNLQTPIPKSIIKFNETYLKYFRHPNVSNTLLASAIFRSTNDFGEKEYLLVVDNFYQLDIPPVKSPIRLRHLVPGLVFLEGRHISHNNLKWLPSHSKGQNSSNSQKCLESCTFSGNFLSREQLYCPSVYNMLRQSSHSRLWKLTLQISLFIPEYPFTFEYTYPHIFNRFVVSASEKSFPSAVFNVHIFFLEAASKSKQRRLSLVLHSGKGGAKFHFMYPDVFIIANFVSVGVPFGVLSRQTNNA